MILKFVDFYAQVQNCPAVYLPCSSEPVPWIGFVGSIMAELFPWCMGRGSRIKLIHSHFCKFKSNTLECYGSAE